MLLEINKDVVHAGLSDLLKLSVIDFVLPPMVRPMLSSPHNTQLLVILVTTDVVVDILMLPGNSTLIQVSQVMHVSHTLLVQEEKVNAQRNAKMDLPSICTSLRMLEHLTLLKMLKLISSLTDQLKLDLKFMKISWDTKVVFTNTLMVASSEDMQLRLLVGVLKVVLTIGSLLTLGVKIGVKKVSSESKKVNVNSKVN